MMSSRSSAGLTARWGHRDLRGRDPQVQVDADGGFAGDRADVKPADFVPRGRTQLEYALPVCAARYALGAEAEVVAAALIISRGPLVADVPGRDTQVQCRTIFLSSRSW